MTTKVFFFKPGFFALVVFMLILQACQPTIQQLSILHKSNVNQDNYWDIDLQYPVFSSSDSQIEQSLSLFNQQVSAYVSALQDSVKAESKEVFEGFAKDGYDRPEWTYELGIRDSVFMATDEFVSLRLSVYRFTGGAHGMTNFVAFNYDVARQKMLTTSEVLDLSKSNQIDELLQQHFDNPSQCFDGTPTLDLVSAINFTQEAVCFKYEQYELGAYACGPAEVVVPKAELGEAFLPQITVPEN